MTLERWIFPRKHWASLFALGLASVLCVMLAFVRMLHVGHSVISALVWNLMLAWIPLFVALPLHVMRRHAARWWPATALCVAVWVLFFPNAPYILTDVVHLLPRHGVPYWYDQIAVLAFALTGLLIGYFSLFLMQEVIREWFGRVIAWGFVFVSLALAAFGIYLGRFVRLNSWDVLFAPAKTLANVARAADPLHNPQALAFSVTFFAVSSACYLIIYTFAHLGSDDTARADVTAR